MTVLDGLFLCLELQSHLVHCADQIGQLFIFLLEYLFALFQAVQLLDEGGHLAVILRDFGLSDGLEAFVLGFEDGVLGLGFLQQ